MNDWKLKESAILALGAIAEGCSESIRPYLSAIIPYLIKMLEYNEP